MQLFLTALLMALSATFIALVLAPREAATREPASYHHGQSNTGWQQLNTANAIACHTYMPPADVVRCLIATGAAI
jgi:hypothetical protein